MSRAKLTLPGAAVAAGLAAGWLADGGPDALTGLAVVVAAMNGYSKAYSP